MLAHARALLELAVLAGRADKARIPQHNGYFV
jgi:hypothetical protein